MVLLSHDGPQYAQMVFDEPVHALVKDRFIVRSADGSRTLAGGVVLDPFPPTRGRRRPERLKTLSALDAPDAGSALGTLLPIAPDGIDLERFAQAWNLAPDQAQRLWTNAGLARFENRGYDALRWRLGRDALLAQVGRFHLEHPDSFGPAALSVTRANSLVGQRFQLAILDSLIHEKLLVREGAQIRKPAHAIELSPTEKTLWRRIAPLLGPDHRPMTMHDIAANQQLELKTVKRVLERAARAGMLVRIATGRYLHKSAFIDLAAEAETLAANSENKLFDAAAFRDRSDLGRNLSIELLEYFDRIGFTQRVGDQRRLLKPAAALEALRFVSAQATG